MGSADERSSLALGAPEALLDALVRHTGDSVAIIDLDGRVVRWNPACEELFGWSASECIGAEVPCIPTELRRRALAEIRAAAASGRVVEHGIEAERRDGSRVAVQGVLVPVEDAEGAVVAVMWVLRDVGADSRLDRQRSEFAALVGKRLREPLAAINASAQLLSRPEIAGDAARRAKIASTLAASSSQFALALDDMLLFSQITDGGLRLNCEPLDVGEFVSELVGRHVRAGERVSVELEPEATVIEADKRRLAHAFAYLLDNAITAAPPGSPVRVSVSRRREWIEVRVADKGIPVDASEREKVFDPFYDGHDARGRLSGPLTLGIARGVTVAHGGTLTTGKDPGGGTVFTLRLPSGRSVEPSGGSDD